MVKMTLIARVTDGLPLAEWLDDGRDLPDSDMYKQQFVKSTPIHIFCYILFTWNTKQVSLWDAIIPEKEHAKFWIQISNKYRFIDQNPPEQKKSSKDKKSMRRAEKERLKEGEAADEELRKRAADELTEQQSRQLHFDLESSYNSFMAALPKALKLVIETNVGLVFLCMSLFYSKIMSKNENSY